VPFPFGFVPVEEEMTSEDKDKDNGGPFLCSTPPSNVETIGCLGLSGEVSGLRIVLSFPFSFVIVVWIVCACVCVELGLYEEEPARSYEGFRMISHRFP